MAKTTSPLLPPTADLLRQFADRLRLARQRRKLPAKQVAQRAGMSPMTLRSLERGGPGVTMGAYLAVMQVLGIERDIGLLAQADPLGRELQDARLPAPLPRSLPRGADTLPKPTPVATPRPRHKVPDAAPVWAGQRGFTSANTLSKLIAPPAPAKKRQR